MAALVLICLPSFSVPPFLCLSSNIFSPVNYSTVPCYTTELCDPNFLESQEGQVSSDYYIFIMKKWKQTNRFMYSKSKRSN